MRVSTIGNCSCPVSPFRSTCVRSPFSGQVTELEFADRQPLRRLFPSHRSQIVVCVVASSRRAPARVALMCNSCPHRMWVAHESHRVGHTPGVRPRSPIPDRFHPAVNPNSPGRGRVLRIWPLHAAASTPPFGVGRYSCHGPPACISDWGVDAGGGGGDEIGVRKNRTCGDYITGVILCYVCPL